jgi:shikimate dehydrogenase
MFLNQAVLQFERFTGVAAPAAVMRQVVMEHLRS